MNQFDKETKRYQRKSSEAKARISFFMFFFFVFSAFGRYYWDITVFEVIMGFSGAWFVLLALIAFASDRTRRIIDDINDVSEDDKTNERGVAWGKLPLFWNIRNHWDSKQVSEAQFKGATGMTKEEYAEQHGGLDALTNFEYELWENGLPSDDPRHSDSLNREEPPEYYRDKSKRSVNNTKKKGGWLRL